MIKSLILSVLVFTCHPAFAQDNGTCRDKGPSEIVRIFDLSIALNDEYKKSTGGFGTDERQRPRKVTEQ
jgi:hypothetical protein